MKLRLTLDVDYLPHGVKEGTLRDMLELLIRHAVGEGMLTGSTEAEVDLWKTKVERMDKKARVTTAKTPIIRAECHSDDHNIKITFDAVKWFKKVTDADIQSLAQCCWGGDYPADNVAEHFEKTTTKPLFDYLHSINEPGNIKSGFECHVDEKDAMRWLKENRPTLYKTLNRKKG